MRKFSLRLDAAPEATPDRFYAPRFAPWLGFGEFSDFYERAFPVSLVGAERCYALYSLAKQGLRGSLLLRSGRNGEAGAALRNRMPAVLGPEKWPAWLGEQPADAHQLKAMLAPYPIAARLLAAPRVRVLGGVCGPGLQP